MIKTTFLFITLFIAVSAEVTVLNNDNFDDHVNSNEYVLVKFYAPWCGHCKKLAPHYDKLSTDGVQEVSITKVDATVDTALAQKHGIKGYPTLKWFINGTEYDFKGGRDFDSMNAFLKKETGEWATFITDTTQLNDFVNSLQEEDAFVISNYAVEELRPLASKLGQLSFGHVTVSNLIPDETLRVYTKFEGEVDFHVHDNDEDAFDFIRKKSIPLVNKLDSKAIKRGFDYSRQHMIVFSTPETYNEVVKQMTPVADKYSPSYIFVTVKHTNKQVVDMFGVEKFPAAFLVNLAPKLVKYPMAGDVTSKSLEEHIEAFENGELVASLKSEEEPEQETGKPHVLVGKTFDKFIKENNNVLVKFYAPWCGHCKKLAPTWDELAEKFVDEDVVIAKYDATANENEGVDVKGFPTIRYYKNGNPIDYNGARDFDSFDKFIGEQTTLSNSHKEL